jgi:hypothetical protein
MTIHDVLKFPFGRSVQVACAELVGLENLRTEDCNIQGASGVFRGSLAGQLGLERTIAIIAKGYKRVFFHLLYVAWYCNT